MTHTFRLERALNAQLCMGHVPGVTSSPELWVPARATPRTDSTGFVCACCGKPVRRGETAWKPMTNKAHRRTRVHHACMPQEVSDAT